MPHLTDSRVANLGAQAIHSGLEQYRAQFQAITNRAQTRFEQRDWSGVRADAAERLDLYGRIIDRVVAEIRELLAERLHQKLVWASIKAVYSSLITNDDDWEIAETFYNSVTRRIFTTVGVDPQIEFVSTDFETPPTQAKNSVYCVYDAASHSPPILEDIIYAYGFRAPFVDLRGHCLLIAAKLEAELQRIGALRIVERVEMIKYPFYRGMAAYLVGRLYSGSHLLPFVLALLNTPKGIIVDAALLDEASVSILFSFARAYFHVAVKRPYDLVQFLKTIMPRKKTAELYISIGFHKHGKTELYRDLLHHLNSTNERFRIARGQRGMVMAVFNMPNYEVVFKVIKDMFSRPKTVTRQDVMARYDFVFRHDRAGRLVDAQTFEHLQFEHRRFHDELLAELLQVAGKAVQLQGENVVISHAYVERRVIPLDVYIQQAHDAAAEAAIIDYGQAIKDLAASNIFPGDMLLKNFGVTRHGRVVFYDYDELCPLSECRFRKIPPASSYEDELSDQPWFHVQENDIFPEEFPRFLGVSGRLRQVFMAHHADLCTAEFWQETQARLQAGELIHIFPYDASHRFNQGHK